MTVRSIHIIMEKQREAYREEAYELLADLENSLLELEGNPDDTEQIGSVFRALHTIKGSGAMFGFDDIAAFTHDVETVFDMVRDGKIAVTRDIIDMALSARDHIKIMLDASEHGGTCNDTSEKILSAFRELTYHAKSGTADVRDSEYDMEDTDSHDSATFSVSGDNITCRIRFQPSPDIFATGTNPVLLLDELMSLGHGTLVARTEAVPQLAELDAETCHIRWDIVLTTSQGINAIKDVFIFVEEKSNICIEVIDEDDETGEPADYKRLGDILIERGDLSTGELTQALTGRKRIGELLVDKKVVEQEAVASALAEQDHIRARRKERHEMTAGIRVSPEKMDDLVNLMGELMTVQAGLSRKAVLGKDPELVSISEEVERLTGELRDNAMSIRMVPISSVFSRFRRLIRDLSKKLRKKVVVETEGGETELDKTIIDQLNDPLMHIIRNTLDHDIEQPVVRMSEGKPEYATIRLSAKHSGASVIIRIESDGAGIDFDAIRDRALEKKLIRSGAGVSEKELLSLMFLPGFSTAKKVSDVSGRGVGLDVVRRGVESLSGLIDMENRESGGVASTLRLPLTLAIIDSLLVKIGDSCFAMPLSAVEECVELQGGELFRVRYRNVMNFRDHIIPYLNLRSFFMSGPDMKIARGKITPGKITPGVCQTEQVIVSQIGDQRIGFGVDHIVGQHQTVIKTLGRIYRDTEGISGATIMGDGTVALILDVSQLVQAMEKEDQMAGG